MIGGGHLQSQLRRLHPEEQESAESESGLHRKTVLKSKMAKGMDTLRKNSMI